MNELDSKQMDTSEVPVVTCNILGRKEKRETIIERNKERKKESR